jgi:hypothetical protein
MIDQHSGLYPLTHGKFVIETLHCIMTKIYHNNNDEKSPGSACQLLNKLELESPALREKISHHLKKMNAESIQQHKLENISINYANFRQNLECLTEIEQADVEDVDKHFLKGSLAYFGRLYTTGKIGEDEYISLITQAAESYIERLISSKIEKYLKKSEFYLNKASIFHFF